MPPVRHTDADACAAAIIARVGNDLRVGMPLGLGKPNQLINALYRRAQADASISLRIYSALSLERPLPAPGLETAFMAPVLERLFGDYCDLAYMVDLRAGRLPANVEVHEFYFKPGGFLGSPLAQQHYICSNYTHAARDVFANGCNVAMQLVARRVVDGEQRLSQSCNPDTAPELIALMRAAAARGERRICVVAQVHEQLPWMEHDALVAPGEFDFILDNPDYSTRLFGTPKDPVGLLDYAIGLHASSLIRDGGTLQIGIGALGDAIVEGARLRQHDNPAYCAALDALEARTRFGELIEAAGGTAPFAQGLYGATEMFVDGFLHLYQAGILRRRVYDFAPLQRLLNEGRAAEAVTPALLDEMERDGVRVLRTKDFEILQHHGVFRDDCRYELGHVVAPDGTRIMANLAIPESRQALAASCLGRELRHGIVLHGGFFLGPRAFYDGLNAMPDAERRRICMTGVDRINQLDRNPLLYKYQRRDARFINTGLMATLMGAVVSDGLEDGRVLSGVGGQYNFVAMAHHLPGGRSVLMIRAVRDSGGAVSSNIVWSYGHCTIPRHLRDLVVTEYGIADLRSRSDADVIKAMLNVADSRFQPALLAQAQAAGKLEAGYQIPIQFRDNTPARVERALAPQRARGLLPAFPFGTDLSDDDLVLGKALKAVKSAAAATPKWRLLLHALRFRPAAVPAKLAHHFERLQLSAPESIQDRAAAALLLAELDR